MFFSGFRKHFLQSGVINTAGPLKKSYTHIFQRKYNLSVFACLINSSYDICKSSLSAYQSPNVAIESVGRR